MNWWLFGTGVMISVDTIVRIALEPMLAQHPGTVGGAMVAAASAPYGVLMAAAVAVYSLATRSWCPIKGIVLAGILYLLVLIASLILIDTVLTAVGRHQRNYDAFFFAESFVLIGLSFIWRRKTKVHNEIPNHHQRSPREDMTEESKTIRPRHQTASLVMLILDVIGLLVLLYGTTVVASRFRQIFEDLLEGRSLPSLTYVILSIPGPVYVLCIVGVIAGLVWKEPCIRDKTRTLIMNIVVFITVVVLIAVFVIAFFLPLVITMGSKT